MEEPEEEAHIEQPVSSRETGKHEGPESKRKSVSKRREGSAVSKAQGRAGPSAKHWTGNVRSLVTRSVLVTGGGKCLIIVGL